MRGEAVCALGSLAGAGMLALGLPGCNKDTAPAPNRAPVTSISSGPADGARVSNHIDFNWFGGDFDGTIAYYECVLDTSPRAVNAFDQVVPRVPAPNDPRWKKIFTASLFLVAPADTLRADPRGDIGEGIFDRWSTFYVRAVDNDGEPDPTPEMRTFDASTQAPQLWLEPPLHAGATDTLPRTFVMNWDGFDPIGTGTSADVQVPRESRWVLLQVQLDGAGRPVGFPARLYDLPESDWSAWAAWSLPDSPGREAVLRDVVTGTARQAFVFAVQGRDDGGAVTPKFDAATPQQNDYAVLVADPTLPVGPSITVRDTSHAIGSIGPWTFAGMGTPLQTVTTSRDTLFLQWDRPGTERYGAAPCDCRFGWNVADDTQYSAWISVRPVVRRTLRAGGDRFTLQCRDHVECRDPHGIVTTAVIEFMKTPAGAAIASAGRRVPAGSAAPRLREARSGARRPR